MKDKTHYLNAQWQLEALLYAVKREAACINEEVMDRIQFTYEVAHSIAQDKSPEKTTEAKKKYIKKENLEYAEIVMDSECPTTCESIAKKLGDVEIRVNPNDLTVFQVNFKT